MHPLFDLYGEPSADFIEGFTAAMEYFHNETSRLSLTLYGRPITREELELEKKDVLEAFTNHEEEIEL